MGEHDAIQKIPKDLGIKGGPSTFFIECVETMVETA